MVNLEKELDRIYEEFQTNDERRLLNQTYLNLLKLKDIITYEHSIRVGLKAKEVVDFTNTVNPKKIFYSGLLHDVGKILTDSITLKKTEDFDEKDMKEIERHVLDGYYLLKGIDDFSSLISLYHHYFSNPGYPKKIPKIEPEMTEAYKELIFYSARVVGIVDFYDSITHRKNGRFSDDGKAKLISRKEARKILIEANKEQEYFIDKLYDAEIFE